ncbi:unnamed protein product [Enterobius vermicularis]|uniref:O-acyltransferase n=1 Tax=Enterobius vermicularis TaxID=51028 RepID=A0A0N4UZ63_ENTVE|nr:unnamed protein product [Enterobius vermicularis]
MVFQKRLDMNYEGGANTTEIDVAKKVETPSTPVKVIPRERAAFREKQFKVRCSLLTTFSPFHHLWLIYWNFAHLPQTLLFWFFMALSSFIPYFALKQWSQIPVSKMVGFLLIILYVFYIFLLFYIPLRFLFWMDLSVACSFIITCENTRILMKVHSYIREIVPRVLRIKKSEPVPAYPTIGLFIYFFFCPSFIYADEYARTPTRSYKKVVKYFLQAVFMIYCTNLVFTQIVHSQFVPINYAQITVGEILATIYPAILPAMSCLILLFYGLLHCWLNAFAELLQFGDREYYLDWWNSRSMAEYYRKWNMVVHEWLYAYVYRDLTGSQSGTMISQICVFFLSSVFHEYWFGVSLRFFYPVMFILYFVFGGLFFLLSRFIRSGYIWNGLMWGNLLIGTGMFMTFYSQEWYSRHRCPPVFQNQLIDILVPRHWFCTYDTFYANEVIGLQNYKNFS